MQRCSKCWNEKRPCAKCADEEKIIKAIRRGEA